MKHNPDSWQNFLNLIYIAVGFLLIGLCFVLVLKGPFHKYANTPIRTLGAIGIPTLFISLVVGWRVWKNPKDDDTLSREVDLTGSVLRSDFIINAMTDAVVVVNADYVITTFNEVASELTDWPVKDAVGLDYRSVLQLANDKEKSDNEINILANILKTGETQKANVHLISRSRENILISLSVSPILDSTNRISGAVIVFSDITKEAEAQEQRADFISTASHEMRTPVAAIEGYLALAMNDKVSTIDDRAREFLEKAHGSTQSLGKLFKDLLTSAKADDGRLSNTPTVLEIGQFLESATSDLKFLAQKKGLKMIFHKGASDVIDGDNSSRKTMIPLYYVYADPERLREVINNLFDNAVKYTKSGTITIGVTGESQFVQFFVQDTGIGIKSEDIPHLFEKFYRVDNSMTHEISGTGLGLFIAQKMINLCKGQMWAESELGKGTTFYVNLPRLSLLQAREINPNIDSSISGTSLTSK